MDSRATVTAELTLAHTASLPPAPASAKTRMTVSRPNLEAALVRETCGLLNTRGSLPPDHPLRAAIEGKGFMEGIADYLTEKAAPAL